MTWPCWHLQPDINVPAYLPIIDVSDVDGTVTVAGNYSSLGGSMVSPSGGGEPQFKPSRFRIFAPPGVVRNSSMDDVGTLDPMEVSGKSSRCLYKGYRYESPLAGFYDFNSNTVSYRQTGLNFAGMYYTLHRHYDPVLMRFTSPDPLAAPFYNLYHYAGNSPMRYFDPDGLWAMAKLTRLWLGDSVSQFTDAELEEVVGTDRDALYGASYAARNILTGKYGPIGLITGDGLYGHFVSREEFGAEYGVRTDTFAFALGEAGTEFVVEAAMVVATAGLAAPGVVGARAAHTGGTAARTAATTARTSAQRTALLNRVREVRAAGGTLSEAKGVVFTTRAMQSRGYKLLDASLHYGRTPGATGKAAREGIDLVFQKGRRFAVAEAKAGAGAGRYSRLATDAAGRQQGSRAWNRSRLQRYLARGDGTHNALAQRLLDESQAGRLRSFAGFYGNRRFVQLSHRIPNSPLATPAIVR
jgi:RHS repeat-associated protein